jgi:hypothetical protein
LALCAVLAGACSHAAIAEWTADSDRDLRAVLGIGGPVPPQYRSCPPSRERRPLLHPRELAMKRPRCSGAVPSFQTESDASKPSDKHIDAGQSALAIAEQRCHLFAQQRSRVRVTLLY